MELSQRTVSVLKNFHSINPSLMFREGNVLKTISPRESIFAKAVLKEHFSKDFGVYDLGKMLGALSLFETPEVEIGDHQLIIKGQTSTQNEQRINLTFANENSIKTIPAKMSPSRGEPICTFNLQKDLLTQTLKTAGVLGLEQIAFEYKNDVIRVKGVNTDNTTADSFDIDIYPEKELQTTFNVVISTDLMKMIPQDYQVTIFKPLKKGKQWIGTMVEFEATNLMYAIGFEFKQTTFGE